MTRLFTIRGSEDGNIAVATSAKAACRIAVAYLSQCPGLVTWQSGANTEQQAKILASRSRMDGWFAQANHEEGAYAEVEAFDGNIFHGLKY